MTILLLAGTESLVVTTFPLTDVPVIWKVCPLDDVMVVSEPAAIRVIKMTRKAVRVLWHSSSNKAPRQTIFSSFTANLRAYMCVTRRNLMTYKMKYTVIKVEIIPCVLWPCLTQVAKDCWKFLFCWNVMGVPILVDSTTFVGGVPWPEIEPTMTLGVAAGVAVVPVGVAAMSAFCSKRFWDRTQ